MKKDFRETGKSFLLFATANTMGKRKIYDVCIIGAGPAGGYLATLLARRQVSVLLIEQSPLPRPKVCGGGLSQKALELLDFPLGTIKVQRISGTCLAFKNKKVFYQEMPGVGCTVNRSYFDHFLVQQAERAGAILMAPTTFRHFSSQGPYITIATSRKTVHAKILVGADGVFSRVRKQLFPGRSPRLAHAIQARAYPDTLRKLDQFSSCTWMDFGAIHKGYGWIFPQKDHFNIGLYKFVSTARNRPLRRLFEAFTANHPLLRSCTIETIKGGALPVSPIGKQLGKENILLTGDAAGLCESIFGEGIYYALESARLAEKSILSYLGGGKNLGKNYNQLISTMTKELYFSRILADIIYGNARLTFDWLVKNKWVNQQFADLLRGTQKHSTCLLKLVAGLPRWLTAPRQRVVNHETMFSRLSSSFSANSGDITTFSGRVC